MASSAAFSREATQLLMQWRRPWSTITIHYASLSLFRDMDASMYGARPGAFFWKLSINASPRPRSSAAFISYSNRHSNLGIGLPAGIISLTHTLCSVHSNLFLSVRPSTATAVGSFHMIIPALSSSKHIRPATIWSFDIRAAAFISCTNYNDVIRLKWSAAAGKSRWMCFMSRERGSFSNIQKVVLVRHEINVAKRSVKFMIIHA